VQELFLVREIGDHKQQGWGECQSEVKEEHRAKPYARDTSGNTYPSPAAGESSNKAQIKLEAFGVSKNQGNVQTRSPNRPVKNPT